VTIKSFVQMYVIWFLMFFGSSYSLQPASPRVTSLSATQINIKLCSSNRGQFSDTRLILLMSAMGILMWQLMSCMMVPYMPQLEHPNEFPGKWVYSDTSMSEVHDLHTYVGQLALHDEHFGGTVFASAAFSNHMGHTMDFASYLASPDHGSGIVNSMPVQWQHLLPSSDQTQGLVAHAIAPPTIWLVPRMVGGMDGASDAPEFPDFSAFLLQRLSFSAFLCCG
jgi:hypothetical protein